MLFSDLLSSVWAMEPLALQSFLGLVSRLDPAAARAEPTSRAALSIDSDGTAHIPISGPIMRSEIPILRHFGIQHTGAAQFRELVAEAARNPSVRQIQLDVDSPGGQVTAASEMAEDVYAARSLGKRVTARASGTMASAAYWIASQAEHVTASSSASVGAIGVYGTVVDSSKAAESAGVKVHVVSSHELKGAGVPGAPVTENQLAAIKRNIDTYARMFRADIQRGRPGKIADMDEVATGQVWIGGEARLLGLIDAVSSSLVGQPVSAPRLAPAKAAGKAPDAAAIMRKLGCAGVHTFSGGVVACRAGLSVESAVLDALKRAGIEAQVSAGIISTRRRPSR